MRKLIVTLVFLLLIGGTAFYFGWIQFQIPANSYGVIFTKSHGWEDEPIAAGEFVWRWQRLLPTNLTLFVYPVEPQQLRIEVEETLPSGAVYAESIDASVDFSYRIRADVRFAVRPQRLPKIAQEDVEPAELEDWYAELEGPIREELVSSLIDAVADASGRPSRAGTADTVITDLEAAFPELEFLSVSPSTMEFPDYDLYARAKELYLTALEAQETGVAQAEQEAAFELTRQRSRIELLRDYGEVLSEYPVLLDYFNMSAESGVDPLQLEALRSAASEGQ
jgi:hypothetical protein